MGSTARGWQHGTLCDLGKWLSLSVLQCLQKTWAFCRCLLHRVAVKVT